MSSKDNIFSRPMEQVGRFEFDERTVAVFEDMIDRSVPGYRMTVAGIGLAARYFAKPGHNYYDLGCSLGACLISMAAKVDDPRARFVGVDTSPPMLQRCRQAIHELELDERVELRCEDVRETQIENAALVALNFTLQFLPLEEREPLLRAAFDGLSKGGALILSEKVIPNAESDQLIFDLHHEFKRAAGYSDLEISQKRQSLENYLIRETLAEHFDRLRSIGYELVTTWLQCFNFVSILAVKPQRDQR